MENLERIIKDFKAAGGIVLQNPPTRNVQCPLNRNCRRINNCDMSKCQKPVCVAAEKMDHYQPDSL